MKNPEFLNVNSNSLKLKVVWHVCVHSDRRTQQLAVVYHEEINGINWFWCVDIKPRKFKVTLIIGLPAYR